MSRMLSVENLSLSFGGLRAVSNFGLELETGALDGLIGPNGAGKTTVFNLLTGVYIPGEGTIRLARGTRGAAIGDAAGDAAGMRVLNGLRPHQIAQAGVSRTFQNIRLFKDLTVLENVRVAQHFHAGYNPLQAILRTPRQRRRETELDAKALELLAIFRLDGKAGESARNLPYGEQRKLEIARALATGPRLLLLDEPAAGMNPQETQGLMDLIRFIRDRFSLTILLIEHDMRLVMGICEKITVLDYGSVIAVGSPAEISRNPQVIKAYLGEEVQGDAANL